MPRGAAIEITDQQIRAIASKAARDTNAAVNLWRAASIGEYRSLLDAPTTNKGK